MEPLFENRYVPNKKMLVEFMRKQGMTAKPALIVGFWVCYAVLLGMCLLDYLSREYTYFLVFMGLIMLVLSFMPQWYAWVTFRNVRKQNDGGQPESVVTFGQTIEMHEGMVHYSIEYGKLVKVMHLQYSYVLMIDKHRGLMLDPNGFTKGTFESFKQFLREKRPDLLIPE